MQLVKPEGLAAFLQSNPLVVDVRPPEMYVAGEFEGALHLPLADIQNERYSLPKDRPLLLICQRGVLSELAGLYLEAAGYPQVYNLEGGLNRLKK